ncbi:MAG: histidine phosphatase family protein [Gemmatimonadaceae bacterium]
MTTFLLVRHATCDPVGRSLAGRAPGVRLDADGRAQAHRLAARLAAAPLAAVYSSPLERARETAAAIAERAGVAVETHDGLTELDVGAWTGRTFAELAPDDLWRRFNSFRGGTRPPRGELMLEAQARAVAALLGLRDRHPSGVVAAVSHADVIKGIVAHVAGIPLDLTHRLEVSPASVSVVTIDAEGARLLRLNETGEREYR